MLSLLFENVQAVTLDPSRPRAEAIAVRAGRIVAVGGREDVARAAGDGADRVDCKGGALLPAFIDAHCHLLSYAASLRAIDCTAARGIRDIQAALRDEAGRTERGRWLRAFGYEETSLAENRHPNREDLDAAAPEHPVRLTHRSGHASVLNTRALAEAGIDITTEEPPGGDIERDLTTGEPNGVLLGMERRIDGAMPPLPYEELATAVREASQRLLRAGVTCVQDASETNGPAEWALFERLMEEGALPLTVVLMEGFEHLGELPERGADGRLRRGAVKIVVHEMGDRLEPGEGGLRRLVDEAHGAGRQVAIHAVGERAVAAASSAIADAVRGSPRPNHRHRIEHCGILPRGLASMLAEIGIVVVSQPAFVSERGDRYLRLVPEEQRGRLYAFRTLLDAKVPLGAGSDAPVTSPEPLPAVAAAVDRRTSSGETLASGQSVEVVEALRWWGPGAAGAAFLEEERGAIRRGLVADLILLRKDPTACRPGELRGMKIEGVWVEGREAAL